MLTVSSLTVTYGAVRAVDDVSLTVPEGTITAVLGANGAGKTSLLRAVSGLARVRSGRITIGGADVTRRTTENIVRLGLAHAPEGRGVITELTVEENLRLGAMWRRDGREMRTDADMVYGMFPPLAERRHRPAETLSGGERQMLAIGRALMSRPRLLLLDEPSLGLAPRISAQIMGIVRRLRDEQRLTVLLVEQNARSALSIADVGVVLNVGKMVAQADPERLGSDEQLRHAYLGF
jgi:branched-chain amino acid transport system ATP-binding protein